MHLRALHTAALVFLAIASTACAGLEVISANYGTQSRNRDVKGIIAAYIRSNTLSFPVNSRSMGGDPSRGESDFLSITYKSNGREFRDVVAEGKTFTFQGVPQVRPIAPIFGLPILRPFSPDTAPLTVVNRTGAGVRLYGLDRYGQWVWAADIPEAETIALTSRVGQRWVATDETDRVIFQMKATRSENPVIISPVEVSPQPAPVLGEQATVRFENGTFQTIYLYSLDAAGRWTWVATIEPGGIYAASTRIGETWIAANTSNRVVKQTTVAPGMDRVKLH